MKKLIVLLLATVFGISCSEKDADNVVIFVNTSSYEVKAGSVIYFDITSRTINNTVVSIDVSTFDEISGTRQITTLNPNKKICNLKFQYEIPNIAVERLNVQFTFTATDDSGSQNFYNVPITVISNTVMLPERSGITLYSPYSGKPDAYSLKINSPLFSSLADDEDVDIYVCADETDTDRLCREWRSKAGVKFSKYNNYDYATATISSLETVYSGSLKYDSVGDLSNDDVILFGRDGVALGVIKIVGIFDEAGSTNDRYLINIKTVKSEQSAEEDTSENQ